MSQDKDYRLAAVAYWQDRLAKFFPRSTGPTTAEVDMFIAGARHEGRLSVTELERLDRAIDHMRQALELIGSTPLPTETEGDRGLILRLKQRAVYALSSAAEALEQRGSDE